MSLDLLPCCKQRFLIIETFELFVLMQFGQNAPTSKKNSFNVVNDELIMKRRVGILEK